MKNPWAGDLSAIYHLRSHHFWGLTATPLMASCRHVAWAKLAQGNPKPVEENHGKTMGKPSANGGFMGFYGILMDFMRFNDV